MDILRCGKRGCNIGILGDEGGGMLTPVTVLVNPVILVSPLSRMLWKMSHLPISHFVLQASIMWEGFVSTPPE